MLAFVPWMYSWTTTPEFDRCTSMYAASRVCGLPILLMEDPAKPSKGFKTNGYPISMAASLAPSRSRTIVVRGWGMFSRSSSLKNDPFSLTFFTVSWGLPIMGASSPSSCSSWKESSRPEESSIPSICASPHSSLAMSTKSRGSKTDSKFPVDLSFS
jgi:hypothetical protein